MAYWCPTTLHSFGSDPQGLGTDLPLGILFTNSGQAQRTLREALRTDRYKLNISSIQNDLGMSRYSLFVGDSYLHIIVECRDVIHQILIHSCWPLFINHQTSTKDKSWWIINLVINFVLTSFVFNVYQRPQFVMTVFGLLITKKLVIG